MKLILGADHAGYELKEKIKTALKDKGYVIEDMGAMAYDAKDDYPNFVAPVAKAVSEDAESSRGIIIGKSGQGEAMLANRFPHVRAAVFYGGPMEIVALSRKHNDSNILSLGAGFVSEDEAHAAIDLWLDTAFEKGRHEKRIKEIDDYSAK
ncbi:MAG: RpiB/LacA/LacB family sugar-phosphate isomerase [Candidatus Paceibacterota bacterium]|jgi:ribose 5-phosphate isomerase B